MSFLLSRALQIYKDINPSTLTGAIDIIVVEHPDGSRTCTPFHVRFGKLSILRAAEKKVSLRLNGDQDPLEFVMKVGEAGEAFFVLQTEENVPEEWQTSPLVLARDEDGAVSPVILPEADVEGDPDVLCLPAAANGEDIGSRDDVELGNVVDNSNKDNLSKDDFSKDSCNQGDFSSNNSTTDEFKSDNVSANGLNQDNSDGDLIYDNNLNLSNLNKNVNKVDLNEKHLIVKEAAIEENPNNNTSIEHQPQSDTDEDEETAEEEEENNTLLSASESGSGWKTARTSPTTPTSALPKSATGAAFNRWPVGGMGIGMTPISQQHKSGARPGEKSGSATGAEDGLDSELLEDTQFGQEPKPSETRVSPPSRLDSKLFRDEVQLGSVPSSKAHIDTLPDSTLRTKKAAKSEKAGPPHDDLRTESDSKPQDHLRSFHAKLLSRKSSDQQQQVIATNDTDETYTWGWGELPIPSPSVERSQFDHLSHDGKPPPRPSRLNHSVSFPSSEYISSHTELFEGSSKTDFVIKSSSNSETFQISLSGPNVDDASFTNAQVGFSNFMKDPNIADSPDLVIRHQGDCITWSDSAPILAALLSYRQSVQSPLSKDVQQVPNDQANQASTPSAETRGPTNYSSSGSWSKWWKGSQSDPDLHASLAQADAQSSAIVASTNVPEDSEPLETKPDNLASTQASDHKTYAKTLRLSSEQLKTLNLRKGPNQLTFSVTSSYSGVAVATARIFLWDDDDQIVVSDIDGTITKSDALGHVFNMIGRDWTHMGVAKLYTDIVQNGYKVMYLTSRAIGQANSTREYLKGIKQDHYQLPDGPVIMSPDRLFTSFHREVIMRKPEVFKMACLRDVERVFQRPLPFYAGFGNRITDALSYRSVHIPSSRIFTIDSGGEVKMELLELVGYKSSYIHMNELVAYWFPPVQRPFAPEFGDFNFWRSSLPNVQLPDLSPPSPTLSARSETSGRFSMLRFGSSSRKNSEGSTTSRPSGISIHKGRPVSPLGTAAAMSSDIELSEDEYSGPEDYNEYGGKRSRRNSNMPGSLSPSFDQEFSYDDEASFRAAEPDDKTTEDLHIDQIMLDDLDDQTRQLDENLRAADEMDRVPFL